MRSRVSEREKLPHKIGGTADKVVWACLLPQENCASCCFDYAHDMETPINDCKLSDGGAVRSAW